MNVGLDRVHPLAHHEPLVDRGPQPLDAPLEVAVELASVRPGFQARPVDDADAAEVAGEPAKLLRPPQWRLPHR